MKKVFLIGWKDLTIIFRDRAAWIMMLAAPLVLTLGMGFVNGNLSGDEGGINQIPVVVVNQDGGQLADALEAFLGDSDLNDLLAPSAVNDESEARRQVDDDEVAAAVIIPAGLSAGARDDQLPAVEVYANPGRPISASVIETVVTSFMNQVDVNAVSAKVAVAQLVSSGRVSAQDAPQAGQALAEQLLAQEGEPPITLRRENVNPDQGDTFNPMAFFATGMAVFFLMYTVTIGSRSILEERNNGTLPRLLITPTGTAQVLAGKVFGVFLTGFAQVMLLIIATSLMFNLRWGAPLGLTVLVVVVVAAATGWGLLLAAFARTPQQISSIGTAFMLIFGILGGTFIPTSSFGALLSVLSKITPNAWAVDGFGRLAEGGGTADLAGPIGALILMAAALFAVAVFAFRQRRGAMI